MFAHIITKTAELNQLELASPTKICAECIIMYPKSKIKAKRAWTGIEPATSSMWDVCEPRI